MYFIRVFRKNTKMKNINEKVVLLTGKSSGIGKVTAKQLLEMGYIVYGSARRVEKMADLKEEL